jgi:nitrite reductase/ring-hydroxylating ferredoxin subunit
MGDPHPVCPVAELPPGERQIIEIDSESIGVFNVDGEFHALKNVCPHHLAPLCEGTVGGTSAPTDDVGDYNREKDGEIIRCPWHKWEFDITTGESVYNPHRLRTRTYETGVESRGDEDAENCGTDLCGDAPPIETYDTGVGDEVVVVYV